jgi:hypothetical protein
MMAIVGVCVAIRALPEPQQIPRTAVHGIAQLRLNREYGAA